MIQRVKLRVEHAFYEREKTWINHIFPRLKRLLACRRRNFPQVTRLKCYTNPQFDMVESCESVRLQVFKYAKHVEHV